MMRAAYCRGYGSPEQVEIVAVAKPTIQPDEVLIRIYASSVDSADARRRSLKAPLVMKPFRRLNLGLRQLRQPILGSVLAGTIEQVGERVSQWRVGERVYGTSGGRRFV